MNNLRELRKEEEMTLDALAEVTGIHKARLSRYERGDAQPKIEIWERLADFFGVETSYLMGLNNFRHFEPHNSAMDSVALLLEEVRQYSSETKASLDNVLEIILGVTICISRQKASEGELLQQLAKLNIGIADYTSSLIHDKILIQDLHSG